MRPVAAIQEHMPPVNEHACARAQLEQHPVRGCTAGATPSAFVCLLQDASGHSNVLKAGKAEELKNARKRRAARKAN